MRRTAFRVGLWITIAVSILVIAVLVAAFTFVFNQVPFVDLLDRQHHEEMVDIGGLDILVGGVVIGILAIVLAGTLGLLATQRAIAPLVDALSRQRRFVADASHELRTPLAILDARLQALQRSLAADDPHREVVAELRADSRSLIAVVDDLLSSMDVAPGSPDTAVSVREAVEAARSSMQMLAAEHAVHLAAMYDADDAWVAVPETSLHRALVALIDNAIKHSPANDVVTISTTTTRTHVKFAVVDHGAGIRGIAPDRVFDRFARSSEALDGGGSGRTGFGIGLSLVQDTAGRFGGTVEVTETSAQGTTLTISLPRAKA
ncbi:HAMP domain-containing sensor histidine kinase [Microbacterium deminutum]|uniref:sensor histidine kinase n=1 Tax=Microbacterium deminutum TaxID=344164 RepID=UPI0031D79D8F